MSIFTNTDRGSTFKSISGKLRVSFGITSALLCLIIALFYWSTQQDGRLDSLYARLERINLKIEQASNLEKQFFIEESINPAFYETGNSQYVKKHGKIIEEVKLELNALEENPDLRGLGLTNTVDSIEMKFDNFSLVFDSLVRTMKERGFKSYGYEGDMRRAVSLLTNSGYKLDMTKVLSLRRHEKDYILRKDVIYIELLLTQVDALRKDIEKGFKAEEVKAYLLSALDQYKSYFLKIVETDKRIGFRKDQGLSARLSELSKNIENSLLGIEEIIKLRAEEARTRLKIAMLILSILFVALNFLLSFLTTKSLSVPIESLSSSIHEITQSNFEKSAKIGYGNRRDEIGQLSKDFQQMIDRMTERTNALIAQQSQTKQALDSVRRLGNLGQQLAATLKVDEILSISFHSLKQLMDVSIVWVGIYNQAEHSLDYQGIVEGEEQTRRFSNALDTDEHKLGIWVFKNQQKVIIPDFDAEKEKYGKYQSQAGNWMRTVVYLPLSSAGKHIGVLAIQHKDPNAFSDFELDILQGYASYLVVALDNALIYSGLEATVKERTHEVESQKEELEAQKERLEKSVQNVRLLSDIGRKLTAFLSVEQIVAATYEHVQSLMDSVVFGIGLYKEEENCIEFSSSIEGENVLPSYQYDIEKDQDTYSVRCFRSDQDLILNDLESEQLIQGAPIAQHLKIDNQSTPQSIIYLPLHSKGKTIGVITVQSLEKNAYSDNHIYLLRNIGVYAAIALENARNYQQIESQNAALDRSSRKINASINYAKRIQEALLPNLLKVREHLPESFVFLKPRDVVSGDFFWFSAQEEKIFVAALDCTGHGVPGAFMSMIGNELLNEAVIRMKLQKPEEILYHIHKGVRRDLRQYETDNKDGMDMSITVIDQQAGELHFAGAKSPLVYIQNGKIEVIKGDLYPIGGEQREKRRTFTSHTIKIDQPTTFYQFSDGYQDQFGGPNGRKFMKRRMRELLYDIHQKPAMEQKKVVEGVFKRWKGDLDQVDDILLIGVKVGEEK